MAGLTHLLNGFALALAPANLLACFAGVLVGTMVGVLPGLGPTATMSLMLPFTLRYGPETGLIALAGVWYGAMYGGSTTSVLVNIPGESASVITCLDGYQMARQGRAGAALALVAVGSWVAGTIGLVALQVFAPALATAALSFGPPEYLALMLLCFVVLSALIGEDQLKGILMLAVGLIMGIVGIDPISGIPRFTCGSRQLLQGIDLFSVGIGLFGIAEVLWVSVSPYAPPPMRQVRLRDLYPNGEEVRRSVGPVLRGSGIGFFAGLIPGPAPTIATFLSYTLEKRLSRHPQRFGTGMVEGVVGPEAANNGAVVGAMVPLLALGIPFAPAAAILLAGLRMHGVEAGPLLFREAPGLFWGFVAAMYVGNLMLLILNLPLVGIFARVATIRPQALMPVVGILCLIGAYSIRFSLFDVWVMIVAGLFGFLFRMWGFPVAPLVVGMILGPMTENNFRLTALMMEGRLSQVLHRPVAVVLLAVAVLIQVFMSRGARKALSAGEVK